MLIDSRPLHLGGEASLAQSVVTLLTLLRLGRARRHHVPEPLAALPFAHVVLAGGGPVDAVAYALVEAGFDATIAADPLWIAARGGGWLLEHHLGVAERGLVVDVGQTSVKRFWHKLRERIERPPTPSRAAMVAWLGQVLKTDVRPWGIVLALPAEIDAKLQVGACTWPWPEGDGDLVDEILVAADLSGVPTLVLNDAELAALSVKLAGAPPASLVLTLGLGVGAAFVNPFEPLAPHSRARP